MGGIQSVGQALAWLGWARFWRLAGLEGEVAGLGWPTIKIRAWPG